MGIKREDLLTVLFRHSITIIVGAFCVIAMIIVPNFFSTTNIKNIIVQSSELFVVAAGMTFVVLNGGVDFSTTGVIAFASVIGGSIMSQDPDCGLMVGNQFSIVYAILAMILIGLVVGTFNGLVVVSFKMPSFIVTMAMQIILSGLALWYTKGVTIGLLPKAFTRFGTKTFLKVIPYCTLLMVVVFIICHILLSKTKFGRYVYAVGINQNAALISGVPIKKTIIKMFMISGICSALSSIIVTARMASAASSYGSSMFLDIMTSIIIGGTNPAGGFGTIVGTLVGVFFVVILRTSLNLMGVNYYIISIIKGCVIILVACFDWLSSKKR